MLSLKRRCLALVASGALASCAGNGEGLDANGQPIGTGGAGGGAGDGSSAVTADLQSIQDNVFTPICTQCHIGASAPQGLQLDAAHSYALLVGVASNEKPSVLRVKAGDPDNSYIVQKLEGAAGIVGSQMPLNQAPLPASTLTAIRQWIANGAMPATQASASMGITEKLALRPAVTTAAGTTAAGTTAAGTTAAGTTAANTTAEANTATAETAASAAAIAPARAPSSDSFAVTVTEPLDGDDLPAPVATIVIALNHEVDASLVNSTNIAVEALAAGKTSLLIEASAALARDNPSSIVVLPRSALGPGAYRVTVRGTGGGALGDINARTLGADFSFVFKVSPAQ